MKTFDVNDTFDEAINNPDKKSEYRFNEDTKAEIIE